ncbi:DUF1090 domain-containing protein [Pseudomonas sp. X10]
MKLFSSLVLLTAFGMAAGPLQAAQPDPGLTGCAAKRSAIENQLEEARAHNNRGQIAGLEKALKENTEHCTDASLGEKRNQKVLEAKHEVTQRQKDLEKAMKKGDPEKIDKRKAKLAESKAELQEALKELEK